MREDYDQAMLCYRLAQEIGEKIGNALGATVALDSIGLVKVAEGNYQEAMQLEQKALALHEAAGNQARRGDCARPPERTLSLARQLPAVFRGARKSLSVYLKKSITPEGWPKR